ncbi:hypothetical protein [Streptomyces sp. NPDC059271]|uniref:hypothetical protein n=1 Tax=Streptomyces sp. NPDC059271 TaxID=3346799 RepID=UPI0036744CE9
MAKATLNSVELAEAEETAMGRDYRPTRKAAAGPFEHAEQITQRVWANTDSAIAIAELCATEEADARHVAAVSEDGEAFGQVVGGCKHLPSSAEHTHQAATDVEAAHQAEFGPVHAATTSKAREAKPGFYQPL